VRGNEPRVTDDGAKLVEQGAAQRKRD